MPTTARSARPWQALSRERNEIWHSCFRFPNPRCYSFADPRKGHKVEFVCTRVGLRVETHGGRTVLDNLQTAKQLETTYYVTDSKQITDFFSFRDSGIRVNIGLRHINVISVYDDVDHDVGSGVTSDRGADNDYFLNSPNSLDDRQHFRGVISNQCRSVNNCG